MIIVMNVAPTDGLVDLPDWNTAIELTLKSAYYAAKKDYEKNLLDGLANPIGSYSTYLAASSIERAK